MKNPFRTWMEKILAFSNYSYRLSRNETLVLTKILMFCPTSCNNSNDLELHKGFDELARQLHCTVFFKGAPCDKPLFKQKSFWKPPLDKQNDNVRNYAEAVQKYIISAYRKQKTNL